MIPLRPRNLKGNYLLTLYVLYSSLIFLTPFIKGPVDISYLTILFVLASFILYISLLRFLSLREVPFSSSLIYLFSLLFLISILLSFHYSIKPSATIYGFIFMASLVSLGLILSFSFLPGELFKGLFRVLVIVSSLLCIMGLSQYLSGRAHSLFVTPNTFAGYLILILPLVVGIYLSVEERGAKFKLLFVATILYGSIMATGSRGGWIGLMAGTVFFFYLSRREGLLKWDIWNRRLLIALLITTLFFSLPMDFNKNTLSRSEELLTPYSSGSMLDRLRYWESTVRIIGLHPVRGNGFWTYYSIYPKYKSQELKNSVQFFSHNDYLQFWSEIGIIGLLIFLSIVYIYFKEGERLLKNKELLQTEKGALIGSMAGSLSMLIHSLGDFNLYISAILLIFWGYIGYTMNLKNRSKKRVFGEVLKNRKGLRISLVATVTILFIAATFLILKPFLGSFNNAMGISYMKRNEPDKASLFFEKAIMLDPYESKYHSNLANVFIALSYKEGYQLYLKRGEEEIQRATELAPYDAEFYRQLVKLYLRFPEVFRDRDIFKAIGKIFETDPTDPFNHYILYRVFRSRGFLKEAAEELSTYLRYATDDSGAKMELEGLLKEIEGTVPIYGEEEIGMRRIGTVP